MKCLISDFDGTVFCDNLKENIDSIRKFVEDGNIFLLATGRTYESLRKAIKDYNIPYEYLICSDGACIYDKNNNIIYEKFLSYEEQSSVINKLNGKQNIACIMYDNNKNITAEKNNHASRILVKCTNKDYEHQLCDELNSCFDHIYSYISPNWLNISSKENTKLSAIRYLEANNLISNIYTIGNDVNDYDMIKEYNGYIINKNVESMNTIASVSELINKINHI